MKKMNTFIVEILIVISVCLLCSCNSSEPTATENDITLTPYTETTTSLPSDTAESMQETQKETISEEKLMEIQALWDSGIPVIAIRYVDCHPEVERFFFTANVDVKETISCGTIEAINLITDNDEEYSLLPPRLSIESSQVHIIDSKSNIIYRGSDNDSNLENEFLYLRETDHDVQVTGGDRPAPTKKITFEYENADGEVLLYVDIYPRIDYLEKLGGKQNKDKKASDRYAEAFSYVGGAPSLASLHTVVEDDEIKYMSISMENAHEGIKNELPFDISYCLIVVKGKSLLSIKQFANATKAIGGGHLYPWDKFYKYYEPDRLKGRE